MLSRQQAPCRKRKFRGVDRLPGQIALAGLAWRRFVDMQRPEVIAPIRRGRRPGIVEWKVRPFAVSRRKRDRAVCCDHICAEPQLTRRPPERQQVVPDGLHSIFWNWKRHADRKSTRLNS